MTTPPYTLVEKRGIKYARLKYTARDGLIVIVPSGFDESRIPGLLRSRKDWIERQEDRFQAQRQFIEPEPPGGRPERLILRAIGEEWNIDYRLTEAESVTTAERPGFRLLVFGDLDNKEAVLLSLTRWLSRKARVHLPAWLERLSSEHDLPFDSVMIRNQRKRWASCSKSRCISLNVRLLFIPGRLVGYVMIHELVHTREMNHGKSYWNLLRSYEPDVESLDDALRCGWRYLPHWLMVDAPPTL